MFASPLSAFFIMFFVVVMTVCLLSLSTDLGVEEKPMFLGLKPKKNRKSSNFRFVLLLLHCVTNLTKVIFKLWFVAFTWPNLCLLDLSLLFKVLLGRNFVSGIRKLKTKNVKTYFLVKNVGFFQPCNWLAMVSFVCFFSQLTVTDCYRTVTDWFQWTVTTDCFVQLFATDMMALVHSVLSYMFFVSVCW